MLLSRNSYSQLGFCSGSKGDPVFSESFGNGTNYGPALPAGTTNYTFITGNPNDGFYTLFYRTNLYSTWHYSLDHTLDATDGLNGKCLIVNANASTTGEFYKRTVTGLCVNTTFEFSSWLMNIYNPGSGFCGASEIPINVRFEIWNSTETVLLSSGNTGNIIGTATPLWQQFALVFTTTNETSVVLKMKNNGLGGCGNDLAIDDIEFRSCGDLTTISSPSVVGNTFAFCDNSGALSLQATTSGGATYFYQWQTSTNGFSWTDIAGATTANYIAPSTNSLTYYRTKVAQDATNLGNNFCSTLSSVFTFSYLPSPSNAVSNGNATICINAAIPSLSVASNTGTSVNWYDAATNGTLLQANSLNYTPTAAGTFYAEAYNLSTNCISINRTPVTLIIVSLPTAVISGSNTICFGNSTNISFNGTPNAIITYTVNGGSNQTISLNTAGFATVTTPVLTSNSTYMLVSATSSVLGSCATTYTNSILITVDPIATATISGSSSICFGSSTLLTVTGTPNSTITYIVDSGINQSIMLNGAGTGQILTPNLNNPSVYTLVSVSSAGSNACSQSLSQVFIISLIPLPTATISASSLSICSNETSILNFNGTPNAVVTYSENNGTIKTITLNSGGTASIATSSLTTNTTIMLINASLPGSPTCGQALSSSVVVSVNPTPVAGSNGAVNYCSNETTAIALTSSIIGTTFSWTVTQNGTFGATAGSGTTINQVIVSNSNNATATYFVTPFYNGCSGTTIEIPVSVRPLPKPILTDGVICLSTSSTPSSQFYNLSTGLNNLDYNFLWYFNGILILAANENSYNTNQVGLYSVIATNTTTGCVSDVVLAHVSESNQGERLIINQSETFSENPTITANVIGGDGPFFYKLDNGSFQNSNIFTPVSSGFHTITVIDQTYCTYLTKSTDVISYPPFFTPNGDGFNDSWNISGFSANFEILIFDRFGKLIKQISTNGNGWDGTYNGQELRSDDYWFKIIYTENGAEKKFQSHFSLKR